MSELPQGWAEASLEQVAEIKLGKMLDRAKNRGELTPYLRNVNVRWGQFDLSDISLMPMSPEERSALSIKDGDVLVCEGGEPGRCAVWDGGGTDLTFQKALMRVRPVAGVHPHLLAAFLRSSHDAGALERNFTGTTIKHLPQSVLSRLAVPVPPLPEQRRIVAKIDSLTGKSRRARDHLAHIPRLVGKYKQAVLALAFKGDLTRAWRAERGVVALYRTALISDVITDIRYGTAKKCGYGAGATAVLRIPNVQRGEITVDDLKSADFDDAELRKLQLLEGDLLVIRSNGSLGLVGRCAVVNRAGAGMLFAGYLIRLRLDTEIVLPRFAHLWLQSAPMRSVIEGLAKSTSGVNNINSTQIEQLPIKLPAIDEQAEIVRRIDAAFNWIDRLAAEATSARKLVDRLDQAVLAKAFRGELVPQDPADEPASVLLDRIRAEREAAPKSRTRRGGK